MDWRYPSITLDATQAQWLTVDGIVLDIVGALILARAFIWSRPGDLPVQTETRWSGNSDLLKALCAQSVDARWGAGLLVAGFLLQLLSAVGVRLEPELAITVGMILLLLPLGLHWSCRPLMVRRSYMAAVGTLRTDETHKENMRRWFDRPPGH